MQVWGCVRLRMCERESTQALPVWAALGPEVRSFSVRSAARKQTNFQILLKVTAESFFTVSNVYFFLKKTLFQKVFFFLYWVSSNISTQYDTEVTTIQLRNVDLKSVWRLLRSSFKHGTLHQWFPTWRSWRSLK